jgi:hypothetical protein
VELAATRIVRRPAAAVFDFVADSANNPKWQKGMQSCVWTSLPPTSVGSTYEQEARFMGRQVKTSFRVEHFEPGRSITIASTSGSFPITVRRSVEPIDDATSRVTAAISGEPGRFFRLAGPLLRRLAQRSVDADYDRLVGMLERP